MHHHPANPGADKTPKRVDLNKQTREERQLHAKTRHPPPDAVSHEDAHADADAVLAGGAPVELLHASVADERSVQGAEVVT